MKITHISKLMLVALLFLVPTLASAKERRSIYVFGGGKSAFTLIQKTNFENQKLLTIMRINNKNIDVQQGLSAGGGVLYKNNTGHIVLRVPLNGGATFYPTPKSNGLPVEKISIQSSKKWREGSSLDEWDVLYTYSGTLQKPEIKQAEPTN